MKEITRQDSIYPLMRRVIKLSTHLSPPNRILFQKVITHVQSVVTLNEEAHRQHFSNRKSATAFVNNIESLVVHFSKKIFEEAVSNEQLLARKQLKKLFDETDVLHAMLSLKYSDEHSKVINRS